MISFTEIRIVCTNNTLKTSHSGVHKNSIKNQTICHLTADNTNYWILFVKNNTDWDMGFNYSQSHVLVGVLLEEHFCKGLERVGILATRHFSDSAF